MTAAGDDDQKKEEKKRNPSALRIFEFSDVYDSAMMALGVAGCAGDSMGYPMQMFLLADVYNSLGSGIPGVAAIHKGLLHLFYLALAVGFAGFLEGWCWTRTAERQTSVMRRKCLEAVLYRDVGFLDARSSSLSTTTATQEAVRSITTDADLIQDFLADKLPSFLVCISQIVVCLVLSFTLSWKVALIGLPCSMVFVVCGVMSGKLMMRSAMESGAAYAAACGVAEQALSSIKVVASFVGERETMERFRRALGRSTALSVKMGLMKGVAIGSLCTVFVSWAVISWFSSVQVVKHGAKGGDVYNAGMLIVLAGLAVVQVLPSLRSLTEAVAASYRIQDLTSTLQEGRRRRPSPATAAAGGGDIVLENVKGEVEFENVDFAYPSRPDTPVLAGLDIHFHEGKTTGLVGGSGSGKSTVITLLQRFYTGYGGKIILDGHEISTLRLDWLRSQMGLVNQEPALFGTTIKQNILFGNDNATMDDIVAAAKAANAHDFITGLANGYDTHVGHFGFQMSGGQKQRIAIARAMVRDPRLLLLDEATSSLDAQSEGLVQEALDHASVGRTTVVIAHRLATLFRADSIAVLKSGRIVESGTYQDLTDGGGVGVFAEMMELQLKSTPTRGMNHSPLGKDTPEYNFARSRIKMTPKSEQDCPTPMPTTPPVGLVTEEETTKMVSKKKKEEEMMRWRLLKMNKPEWPHAVYGCLGAMMFGAVSPSFTYSVSLQMSAYFIGDRSATTRETKEYVFLMLVLGFIHMFSAVLCNYCFAAMGERLTERVRKMMLEKMLSFEMSWFDEHGNSSASLCVRLTREAGLARSLVGDTMSLAVQTASTTAAAYVIGLIASWRLTLVVIATQPAIGVVIYLRHVFKSRFEAAATAARAEGSRLAGEVTANHRTITAFSSQRKMLELYAAAQERPSRENLRQCVFAGAFVGALQFFLIGSMALSYFYGTKLLERREATSRQVFVAVMVAVTSGRIVGDAASKSIDLFKGGAAVKSVLEVLDRKTKIDPDAGDVDPLRKEEEDDQDEEDAPAAFMTTTSRRPLRGDVEFKNVFFSYPSRPEQLVLADFNLRVDSGKTVALVGRSGSGKSTVLALVERFYDPTWGSVTIDGVDIRSYNLKRLRTRIGLVSQEPVIFSGTIRDNIAYGSGGASTQSEIEEVAARANAHEFISGMEKGYDTGCGERGTQLSGGQKQRIALARVLLKDPDILLLDEVTSALDSVSEGLVQETLERMSGKSTLIVVAHRLSTIQNADTVAVVRSGRIVEEGSHSDLIAMGEDSTYYDLVRSQFDQGSSAATS